MSGPLSTIGPKLILPRALEHAHGEAVGSFAWVVLLYGSALLLASVVKMKGGELYFFYAHAFFLAASTFIILATREGVANLLRPLQTSWSAVFLVAFLFYFATMAFLYPDPAISQTYVRSLTIRVLPGFLMGYLAFATLPSPHIRLFPGQSGTTRFNWHFTADMIALGFYAVTLVTCLWALSPLVRSDIFFIAIPRELVMYQLLEVYLVGATIPAFVILHRHFSGRYLHTVSGSAVWMMLIAAATMASFFLCQMAGSNMGAALVGLIGAALGGWTLLQTLRTRTPYARAQAAAMLAVGMVATLLFAVIVSQIPPLRILNYQSVEAVPDAIPSSITSRYEIVMESGWAQIALSPIFGDLGADHVIGKPGSYIHSILSVQSHLGLIGSVLLFGFLLERVVYLYRTEGNSVLKVSATLVLAMAATGTFFTWMSLWFSVGALYAMQSRKQT